MPLCGWATVRLDHFQFQWCRTCLGRAWTPAIAYGFVSRCLAFSKRHEASVRRSTPSTLRQVPGLFSAPLYSRMKTVPAPKLKFLAARMPASLPDRQICKSSLSVLASDFLFFSISFLLSLSFEELMSNSSSSALPMQGFDVYCALFSLQCWKGSVFWLARQVVAQFICMSS